MIDKQIPTPGSKTGETITLVTSNTHCVPSEVCRPLNDTDSFPEYSPDCTCAPYCEEQGKEHKPDQDQHPSEEDQYCEPNI